MTSLRFLTYIPQITRAITESGAEAISFWTRRRRGQPPSPSLIPASSEGSDPRYADSAPCVRPLRVGSERVPRAASAERKTIAFFAALRLSSLEWRVHWGCSSNDCCIKKLIKLFREPSYRASALLERLVVPGPRSAKHPRRSASIRGGARSGWYTPFVQRRSAAA
jgi:hypothetical protein